MDQRLQQAMQLFAAGQYARARPLLLALAQRRPNDPTVLMFLGQCHTLLNDLVQAEYCLRKMLAIEPRPDGWVFLAKVMLNLSKPLEASACVESALKLVDPGRLDHPVLRDALWVTQQNNDFALQRRLAQGALSVAPDRLDMLLQLANALGMLGRIPEARDAFARAAAVAPNELATLHGLSWISVYDHLAPPEDVFAHHVRYGEAIERTALGFLGELPPPPPTPQPPPPSTPAPPRPLRVGLFSSDLRRHSVAYFVLPLLKHHEMTGLDLHVFATASKDDDMTAQLRGRLPADRWNTLRDLKLRARAERIRAAGLDVLIELSGQYVDETLAVMALRPAPVQVDYLGYPHTTGLPAMGFRLVDALTDPPGTDRLAREKLVRIDDCFICFEPPPDTPPIGPPRPVDAPITFATFNNPMKLNDEVFALWGKLLAMVPGSSLLIKTRGLEHAGVRADTAERLARAGVPADRVELSGWLRDRAHHLSAYHQVDIALDPFPYHGTTTTCEALLMGVPVVTLAGAQHACRVGVSLLQAVGTPELIARTPEEYVRVAADLAADRPRLAALRTSLRDRLLRSPLGDSAAFARRFGDAVRRLHASATQDHAR